MAYKNLKQTTIAGNLEFVDDAHLAVFYNSRLDGFDASRILVKNLRVSICKKLKVERCCIGIPNRDLFIACRDIPQIKLTLQEQVKKDFETNRYRISSKLFYVNTQGEIWVND